MEAFLCAIFAFALGCGAPSPAATPTPTVQQAPTAIPTAIPTATAAPTATPVPATATPRPRVLRLPPPDQAPEIATGDPRSNKIALTFDAGIRSPHIGPILDQLRAAGVRSTMFLTGHWAEMHPEFMVQMVADGHEMANHSQSHPNFTEISNARIVQEVEQAEEVIRRLSGKSTKPWFRPPSGDRDARVNRVIGQLGYYSIYWSLDSLDWMENVSAAQVLDRTVTRATNGSIIVMHLTSPQTAQVLPEVIRRLKARGFELVLVSELLSDE